jgi:hypothetical protein
MASLTAAKDRLRAWAASADICYGFCHLYGVLFRGPASSSSSSVWSKRRAICLRQRERSKSTSPS